MLNRGLLRPTENPSRHSEEDCPVTDRNVLDNQEKFFLKKITTLGTMNSKSYRYKYCITMVILLDCKKLPYSNLPKCLIIHRISIRSS